MTKNQQHFVHDVLVAVASGAAFFVLLCGALYLQMGH
jgi:hypothetical protein